MKILALDTATEACSAALYCDGEISTQYQIAPRRHAELILTMVDTLLAENALTLTQLDALAFGRGPGAFTGVRIATAVVQGLALSAGLPVVPVSTLATLAQGALSESQQIACAIDARMAEVYWGLYQADDQHIMRLIGQEHVCSPDAVEIAAAATASKHGWFGIGSGWSSYADKLQIRMGKVLSGFRVGDYPSAEAMCILAVNAYQQGHAVDAAEALPVYLRDKVANQPA